MIAVVLLAGMGRRIRKFIGDTHKSLLEIDGFPILWYLVNNLISAGIVDVIAITGYQGKDIERYLKKTFPYINLRICKNNNYEHTNNLVSLLEAEKMLLGNDFIVINGDMVFDCQILINILRHKQSAIAIDSIHKNYWIDSPCTIIENGRILDLGRDIEPSENSGYAIGLYKFSSGIAGAFFEEGKRIVLENPNAGFHDPLRSLFHKFVVLASDVEKCLWTDIDDIEDIKKAERYIRMLEHRN